VKLKHKTHLLKLVLATTRFVQNLVVAGLTTTRFSRLRDNVTVLRMRDGSLPKTRTRTRTRTRI